MATELVPIRIAIRLGPGPDGKRKMLYPAFNDLPTGVRGGMDWCHFIDSLGGLHYDKQSGFGIVDDYNADPETQFCAALVPQDFADAALTSWPDRVSTMSEAEFAAFYDDRAHAHEPAEVINAEILNGIRAKYGIVGAIEPAEVMTLTERQALDPAHPAPGIVANPNKTWAQFKARRAIRIKAAVERPPQVV